MTEQYERPRKLYRVRNWFGFGVCHGIAEYLDWPVSYVQAIALILCLVMRIWPFLILYFIAALVIKPKPEPVTGGMPSPTPPRFVPSRRAASLQQVKETTASLDRRIQRMENVVTSREYDWDRRLNS